MLAVAEDPMQSHLADVRGLKRPSAGGNPVVVQVAVI